MVINKIKHHKTSNPTRGTVKKIVIDYTISKLLQKQILHKKAATAVSDVIRNTVKQKHHSTL